jgi:predicted RNA-binding protein (virulence factor B family)
LSPARPPQLAVGEVTFLRVTSVTSFGAFVDWGPAKELLVPTAQQTTELEVGARHPIGLYRDDRDRLTGTMRVAEMLDQRSHGLVRDAWVNGEAWRNEPEIGLFVIVERAFLGLLPKDEPHALARGQAARFRVSNIFPDGKLELSLRAHAHAQLADDARRVLELLHEPGMPPVGDHSSPELLRQSFGLSKKAFKRAVGRLLVEKAVEITPDGFVRPRPRVG